MALTRHSKNEGRECKICSLMSQVNRLLVEDDTMSLGREFQILSTRLVNKYLVLSINILYCLKVFSTVY